MSEATQIHHHSNAGIQALLLPNGVVRATSGPTDFVIHATEADVPSYTRQSNDLVLSLRGGTLRIDGFFAQGVDFNHLVFTDGDQWLLADFSSAQPSAADVLLTCQNQRTAADALLSVTHEVDNTTLSIDRAGASSTCPLPPLETLLANHQMLGA